LPALPLAASGTARFVPATCTGVLVLSNPRYWKIGMALPAESVSRVMPVIIVLVVAAFHVTGLVALGVWTASVIVPVGVPGT
jgi:hypothetical protein